MSRAALEVAIMDVLRGTDPEDAAAVLASCKARVFYREMQRAHLLREEDNRPDRLLTVAEAAKVLNVSEKWVRARQDRLMARRIGRHVRIPESAVQRIVKLGLS